MMDIFRPAILYVDDEPTNLETFKRAFGSDYLVKTCLSGPEALKILEKEDFPLVIADQRMPGMTGIELCEKVISLRPQSIRMILTAYTETEYLLDAINRGHVHDYIVKPWRKSELKPILERAFEDYKQKVLKVRDLEARASHADRLEQEIREIFDFDSIIGAAAGLRDVVETVKKVAPTDSTVLIAGETGTGKELIARAIHTNSRRKSGPFVAVHCAALAETVLESELFGHERGAFTGADQARVGRFEAANGGTIFLDEVGEIPEPIQVKLLRVLQEKEIQRVGANRSIPVDVRILAATNRNLEAEVRSGRFREDLYFRLNVIPVRVPPLRERFSDIPHLANFFLQKYNRQIGRNLTFTVEVVKELGRYDWPGNVRELQNVLERAVILGSGPEIEVDDLGLNLSDSLTVEKVDLSRIGSVAAAPGSIRSEIQQKEIQTLTETLRKANGNISEAARLLGVARSTLFHRLKKHRLI